MRSRPRGALRRRSSVVRAIENWPRAKKYSHVKRETDPVQGKGRGGPVFLSSVPGSVARMERSAIRQRYRRLHRRPGLRCAPSGLRRKMKEAERRQTPGNHRRILRCGARPFGARTLDGVPPRLSPKGIIPSQRLSFRLGFLGRGLHGRYPPSPVPVQGCTSPVIMPGDMMPKPPGSRLQTHPRAPPSLP